MSAVGDTVGEELPQNGNRWGPIISKWLREGSDDSEDLVDLPWNVEEREEEGIYYIMAEHPKVPFPLLIVVNGHFVHIFLDTAFDTDSFELAKRLKIYKSLLHLNNETNMMKFTLLGDGETITIRLDLDLVSFNKQVFDDALTALLTGLYMMVDRLELRSEFQELVFDRIIKMVMERIEKGLSREEVKGFLVKRVGINEDDAEKMVEEIFKEIRKERRKLRYIA